MQLTGYGYSHLAASTTCWRKLAVVHLLPLAIPLAVLSVRSRPLATRAGRIY
jgi:hypothetical protein